MGVTLDTIENSRLETSGTTITIHRGFMVDEITTTDVSPFALMLNVLEMNGMPKMNDLYPDPRRVATLVNIEIDGLLPNAVKGRLVYSSFAGGTPTIYTITRASRSVTITTDIHPITRRPIRIADSTPSRMSYSEPEPGTIKGDYCPMTFRMPAQAIRIYGLRIGAPAGLPSSNPGAYEVKNVPFDLTHGSSQTDRSKFTSHVNETPWQGRDRGHWLLDDYETSHYPYGGYHTLTALAITRGPAPMDWSDYQTLRNHTTGRKFFDPHPAHGTNATLDRVMQLPYECHEDIGGAGAAGKGFVRAGIYPLANLNTVFGF